MRWRILFTLLSAAWFCFSACEAKSSSNGDESAIRKQADSYVKAFNNKDPKALVALWAEDGEYVNPRTGEVARGKKELAEDYRSAFEQPGKATLELAIKAIAFPSPGQAVETGTATVTRSGEEPIHTAYKATYEMKDGTWLLTQVREVNIELPSTNFEKLKALDWLVGRWIDEDEDSKIETIADWDKYKNFLTQNFTVTVEGEKELEGKQIIAWDAANEEIRSWVFDSDGGFGEGTWKQEGNQWIVETAYTLADGRRGSAINIYTPVNKDSYVWESTGREVAGVMLPNLEEVTVHRIDGGGDQ